MSSAAMQQVAVALIVASAALWLARRAWRTAAAARRARAGACGSGCGCGE